MNMLRQQEFHQFEAAGQQFLYLVPSAAVFALDDCSRAVLDELRDGAREVEGLLRNLGARFDAGEVAGHDCRADARARHRRDARQQPPLRKIVPLKPVPLQTLVVNVTNQCNLACTYCYEYGEDKIVDTENGKKPKFMSEETARESVEFMLRESRDNPSAHMTFFGGETLLNFPVLKSTIDYARRRAAEARQGGRLQPDDQRHPAAARTSSSSSRKTAWASRFRSTAPKRCRTSSASSRTGWAATTWRRRKSRRCWPGIAHGRLARA